MWYNPVTDANGRLRHVLGAFFPLYASLSKENQDSISEVGTDAKINHTHFDRIYSEVSFVSFIDV